MEFEIVKKQLLEAAKEKDACGGEYRRAFCTQNIQELVEVAKDNIVWIFNVDMADASKLEAWFGEALLDKNNVFVRGKHSLEAREDIVIVLLGSSQATVKTWGGKLTTKCSGGTLQNRTKKTIEIKKSDYEILIVD